MPELFKTEDQALEYLRANIPPEGSEKPIDIAPWKKPLFAIPDEPSEGQSIFKGDNIEVITDLHESNYLFDRCYRIFRRWGLQGKYKPIFSFKDLKIRSDNFSYDKNGHVKPTEITWQPNLSDPESELTPKYVHIEGRKIYLIDKDGFFHMPITLLGLFHETGHFETRSPDQTQAESSSVRVSYSSDGAKVDVAKNAAYELQREKDANVWICENTQGLFDDLGLPDATAKYNEFQLRSYQDKFRDMFFGKDSQKLQEHYANRVASSRFSF
ncbi:MAG: hypothetical protein JW754_01540 [Candidatus Aenigmarchaeota archaeon]|nr:hypothetical protein [Candidatus Aenigmarchaeota archaeon]